MKKLETIKNPYQLLRLMNNIEYKWMDKNGDFHSELLPEMYSNYSLMSPEDVLKNMCGICVDQCELERLWFEHNNYEFSVLQIQIKREDSSPGHIFLLYKSFGKYYWFENAWYDERGIHEYNNYEELISDIKNKFIKQNKISKNELKNLFITEWPQYPYHISYEEIDKINSKMV